MTFLDLVNSDWVLALWFWGSVAVVVAAAVMIPFMWWSEIKNEAQELAVILRSSDGPPA